MDFKIGSNNFMKKLGFAVAGLLAAVVSAPSFAASASNTFNVTITLTSACTVSAPANVALAYTAGGATVTGTTSTNIQCTNTLPYTLSLNGLKGAGVYAKTDASTGLNYTLAFNAAGTGGADVTGTGTGAAVAQTIGVNIASGQFGTCATATCVGTAQVNTVYVNY